MKTLTKALVGTVAAGAMAVSAAAPAFARDGGGIDAGEVIAGALIIGGIAAVAAAASDNDNHDRNYDRDYAYGNNYAYGRAGYGYQNARYGYGDPRQAVQQCVAAAQQNASRWGNRASVTDVRSVRDNRYGYEVKGRIAVAAGHRGYDNGSFTCQLRNGRIADIDYSGIRGL